MNSRNVLMLLWGILTAVCLSGCAAEQVRENLANRYASIAAKIDAADTRGARDYAPRELAHARVELDHTLHEVREDFYSAGELQMKFDKVESVANDLLAKQLPEASESTEPSEPPSEPTEPGTPGEPGAPNLFAR
jgi:hypothetical protein